MFFIGFSSLSITTSHSSMKGNLRSINNVSVWQRMFLDHWWARLILFIVTPRHKRNKSNYSVEMGSARDANGQCDCVWRMVGGDSLFFSINKEQADESESVASELWTVTSRSRPSANTLQQSETVLFTGTSCVWSEPIKTKSLPYKYCWYSVETLQ